MGTANPLDLQQRHAVAAADEDHPSLEFADFELVNNLDRVRLAKRQVQKDEIGVALFKIADELVDADEMARINADDGETLAKGHPNGCFVVEHEREASIELIGI